MFFYMSFYFSYFFFFFSSRRRHTRCLSDWSSDVCSSDLSCDGPLALPCSRSSRPSNRPCVESPASCRSEERRVGKECRSRGWPYHEKKKRKKQKRTTE